MPSTKLTKSVVDTAKPTARNYEIRDTIIPGFFCKITPAGRKTFMLFYRTPTGERRKPALGTYGQITVDQAPQARPRLPRLRARRSRLEPRAPGRPHGPDHEGSE